MLRMQQTAMQSQTLPLPQAKNGRTSKLVSSRKTHWHRVVFRKIAEIAGQYLRKGSKIYVEGKMVTREWEKDGVKRYTTEIIVDMGGTMQMLDGRDDSGGQNTNRAPQNNQQGQQRQQQNLSSSASKIKVSSTKVSSNQRSNRSQQMINSTMTYLSRILDMNNKRTTKELMALLGQAVDLIDVPEKDCRCHVSPPCNDCVEHGHARDICDQIECALEADYIETDALNDLNNAYYKSINNLSHDFTKHSA